MSGSKQVLKNVFSGWAAMGLGLVLSFVSAPIVIGGLGSSWYLDTDQSTNRVLLVIRFWYKRSSSQICLETPPPERLQNNKCNSKQCNISIPIYQCFDYGANFDIGNIAAVCFQP
jgi:hypothetical protein